MRLLGHHSARTRHLLSAAIARAMALVLLFSLCVPHPAAAIPSLDASPAAILTAARAAAAQPGESTDYDVARHMGCACHIGAPAQSLDETYLRTDPDAALVRPAHAPPRPGPPSLPFEPPRA